jgi:hypothetical protein
MTWGLRALECHPERHGHLPYVQVAVTTARPARAHNQETKDEPWPAAA